MDSSSSFSDPSTHQADKYPRERHHPEWSRELHPSLSNPRCERTDWSNHLDIDKASQQLRSPPHSPQALREVLTTPIITQRAGYWTPCRALAAEVLSIQGKPCAHHAAMSLRLTSLPAREGPVQYVEIDTQTFAGLYSEKTASSMQKFRRSNICRRVTQPAEVALARLMGWSWTWYERKEERHSYFVDGFLSTFIDSDASKASVC